MGKKAERIVMAALTAALEDIGVVKVARLFQAAVEDTEALEDGLFVVSEKRERQFADGIELIIKARKGAKRDDRKEVADCGCSVHDECDCDFPSSIASCIPTEKRVNESVALFLRRMQHWTGLHFSINMALAEIMTVDYNVKKLTKKLRKCQSVEELATVLTKKTGGRVLIRESVRGKLIAGSVRLTASSPDYVICLA